MSHYTVIKTKMTDTDCLKQALWDLGYGVIEEGVNLPLFDWRGALRPERADIVVRRQHLRTASNDLGFRKVGDTYEALVDAEFDRKFFGGEFLSKLTQRYAYHKVKKELALRNLTVVEEERAEDNTIRLVVRQWA